MKLSKNMDSVLRAIEAGGGWVCPRKGGYWLPYKSVIAMPEDATGRQWFLKAEEVFGGARAGTSTIYALVDRGMLSPISKQSPLRLTICALTDKAREYLATQKPSEEI